MEDKVGAGSTSPKDNLGGTTPPAKRAKQQAKIWAYPRRKFTAEEARLLLAGEYHQFAKRTGLKLSTARRYGDLVRKAAANDLSIQPGRLKKRTPQPAPAPPAPKGASPA